MEQAQDLIGNPLTLLIERIFWLGLGCFFFLATVKSFINSFKDQENQGNTSELMENTLKKIARSVAQRND